MTTVLLTGYEPFGEFETNPSARLATELDGTTIGSASIVGRELPVSFDRAFPRLRGLIEEHRPSVVVSAGLAAGRSTLTLERVGINVRDVDDVPDNDGRVPVDEPIAADGPDAYVSTLPIREMAAAMTDAGVPAAISNSAGTHLCNEILYATRHHVETNGLSVRSGLVHVPASHEQIARRGESRPSMSIDAIRRGLEAGIDALE